MEGARVAGADGAGAETETGVRLDVELSPFCIWGGRGLVLLDSVSGRVDMREVTIPEYGRGTRGAKTTGKSSSCSSSSVVYGGMLGGGGGSKSRGGGGVGGGSA